jgi:hypothetical protein
MHQLLSKQAAIKASNFDDLVKNLKELQQQGKNFKGHTDPEELARYIMYDKGGSGSIVLDGANALLNKVTGKKRAGDIIKRKLSNTQRKLSNADIKAGNKVQQTLAKNKVTKGMGNAFTYKHKIPLKTNPDGVADEIIQVSVPALTAPIEKVKKAVLPTAGAMYLNSKIMNSVEKKRHKGGDDVVKESEYRQNLKEKIAAVLLDSASETASITPIVDNEAGLLLRASNVLKTAAYKQKEMENDMIKLANENKKLMDELCIIKKADEAKSVADMMLNKGLIKVADVQSKINEMIEMDENAFRMFKQAIENVRAVEKVASGVDDLTFLMESNNIEHRKSLADSLEDAVSEI